MNDGLKQLTIPSDEAIKHLKHGGLGVMPTDTVYGVVASALNKEATNRLYSLKEREQKPGTLVASSIDQLRQLGVPEEYFAYLTDLWPGALSVVLPLGNDCAYLHQGVGDIAIRVVADERFKAILEQTGPLITSSANRPGEPGSVNLAEAWDYFHDDVDFYVDGGDLSGKAPSTIVRLSPSGKMTILRQGAVKL